jgi:hypothetical protein
MTDTANCSVMLSPVVILYALYHSHLFYHYPIMSSILPDLNHLLLPLLPANCHFTHKIASFEDHPNTPRPLSHPFGPTTKQNHHIYIVTLIPLCWQSFLDYLTLKMKTLRLFEMSEHHSSKDLNHHQRRN